MGTYSNVAFAMKLSDYRTIQLLHTVTTPSLLQTAGLKERIREDNIYWQWFEIKWYGGTEIVELDKFMDYLELHKKNFGFIQLSEAYNDPEEMRGDPHEFDMYVHVELHMPDL